MMEKKYTPGPWKIMVTNYGERYCIHGDGHNIVLVNRPVNENHVLHFDATLIAAAPELVEALDAAPIIEAYYINGELESERFMADYEAWWQTRNETLVKAGVIG